nr:MAG TPA: hypothetical protein [Caudoviricetes sp.]
MSSFQCFHRRNIIIDNLKTRLINIIFDNSKIDKI